MMSNQGTLGFTIQDSSRPTHIMVWQEPRPNAPSLQSDQNTLLMSLMERVSEMERTIQELKEMVDTQTTTSIPYFAENVNPLPSGIHEVSSNWEQESEESEEDTRVITILKEEPAEFDDETAEILSDGGSKRENTFVAEYPILEKEGETTAEEEEEGQVEEEQEGEATAEEEEEEEEEEEGDGEELVEFEHNGVTYYRDSENLVYTTDEDGDLNEEPIGRWSEEKQKILKIKK